MLRDAQFDKFTAVYIVCGHTDLRYGIDSLAAIIENHFHMSLFVPNTLFLFCGGRASRIKGLLWEGDGFLLLYKRVEDGRFSWPRNSNEAPYGFISHSGVHVNSLYLTLAEASPLLNSFIISS